MNARVLGIRTKELPLGGCRSRERKRLSVDEERISRGLHDDDVLSGIWECQVDLGRCLCEQCVRDLIDLLGVLLEVRPLRTHINRRKEKVRRQCALDVQIPLLDVTRWMVRGIRLRDRLHDLSEKLLRPLRAETPAGRRGNARWKRKGNCVDRVSPIDCPRVRGGRGIDHIVQRVETEGNVIWNPENSVPAANNRL